MRRNVKISILASGVTVAGAAVAISLYYRLDRGHTRLENPKASEKGIETGGRFNPESAASKKHDLYVCPMHPQITSDKPGQTCPICGMDLVLVDQSGGETAASGTNGAVESGAGMASEKPGGLPAGRASFKLTEYRQQLIGLKLKMVEKKALFRTVHAPGRAAFDPELYTAQTEYQQALRQYEKVKDSPLSSVKANVERMMESSRTRLRILGLTDAQIGAIKAGTDLSEGLLVYRKGGQVWIYADVHEADLRNINPGQAAKISANYLEGTTLAGVVASTDQVINTESRTAKVRIRIDKAPVKMRPESYVDVTILVPQGEHISVPLDAVIDTGAETFVFVSKGNGELEPRRVGIAFRAGDQVAVGSGLNVGEEIVVSGNFLVDSEAQLKHALESWANRRGAPHVD